MSRGHYGGVPHSEASASSVALTTANTVAAATIPGTHKGSTRPVAFRVFFIAGGVEVRGRVGLDAGSGAVPTITDGDNTLGHHRPGMDDYYQITHQTTRVLLACNTASATAYVTWLYSS